MFTLPVPRRTILFSIGLVILTGATSYAAIAASYFVGERFFFDKLFYAKSAEHGYVKNGENPVENTDNPASVEERVHDLRSLLSENPKVLGTSTEDTAFHITVLGDSFVYGMGIRDEQRFVKLLEKKLKAVRPTSLRTFAQPGDSLLDNYSKFKLTNSALQTDLYIIGVVDNDLLFGPGKYSHGAEQLREFRKACPGELVTTPLTESDGTPEDVINNYLYPTSLNSFSNRCITTQIVKQIRTESKVPVLFFSFQHTEPGLNTSTSRTLSELNQRLLVQNIEATIASAGGKVVTFNLDEHQWARVSPSEYHPNADMNRQFSETLFQAILGDKEISFK